MYGCTFCLQCDEQFNKEDHEYLGIQTRLLDVNKRTVHTDNEKKFSLKLLLHPIYELIHKTYFPYDGSNESGLIKRFDNPSL